MRIPLIDRNQPRPLLGLCLMYPASGIAERIGPQWDWWWIDAQHGDLDFRETVEIVRSSHLTARPGLVRVPSHDAGWIGKILDSGAAGVIVPMVETIEEARALVAAAKFPPLGNRSYGGRKVIDLLGRSYYETANRDTLLIAQVESHSACLLAEEFAAMEGIDGLFLGPDDLLIRNGLNVDAPKDRSTIGKYLETVVHACRKHQKFSVGVVGSDASLELAADLGCDLLIGGGDVRFLSEGSSGAAKKLRDYFSQSPGSPDRSGSY